MSHIWILSFIFVWELQTRNSGHEKFWENSLTSMTKDDLTINCFPDEPSTMLRLRRREGEGWSRRGLFRIFCGGKRAHTHTHSCSTDMPAFNRHFSLTSPEYGHTHTNVLLPHTHITATHTHITALLTYRLSMATVFWHPLNTSSRDNDNFLTIAGGLRPPVVAADACRGGV